MLQLLNAADLSGLRVTSSERVALLVAARAGNDHVMTQLTAVNHWHTQYLHTTTHVVAATHSLRLLGMC